MRPKVRSIGPKMSLVTPYEGQRRRVRMMEKIASMRLEASADDARRHVARVTRLSPEQLINIRKGKLKDLYGGIKARIDRAFIDVADALRRDLEQEIFLAHQSCRPIDPGVVARAEASKSALEELIAEADPAIAAAGAAPGVMASWGAP